MSGDTTLEVRVLGTVELTRRGRSITLNRPLERALAVRLALAKGRPVLDDLLVRELWGDIELSRPAERLRVLASRLRGSLGPAADALSRTTGGGYALDAAIVDADAAERALAEASAAEQDRDWSRMRSVSVAALDLWRGPALPDLRAIPFAATAGTRLDALQIALHVAKLGAEVELGASADTVAELEQLAAEQPLHERLTRLLALALFRAGRQADALDRLATLRRALADELGVDPTPETVELELGLLRQDESVTGERPTRRLPPLQMPTAATAFVGRGGERAALVEALTAPTLLTLIGPPGSGKTRLALEVARTTEATGRPVAWVDLGPLHESDAIGPAISAASAIDAGPGDALPRWAEALNGALLVIDNAEHLIDSVAALVASLLRQATRLSVMVTSQRPLLIAREEVHGVGPLSPSAAAALFCARSGLPRSAEVDAICKAVDYLPLGVELAAGLTRTLSLRQLADRVGDRLRLLVGGPRDAGPRHTSLRAALDWSYHLLDEPSATALRRMGVFAGGCTLEAAESVIGDDSLTATAVASALTDLADRCLLSVADRGGEPRFGLLESIREYALDQLTSIGEIDVVRGRHLAWCAAHVTALNVQESEDEAAVLDAIFAEWPNLLSALDNAPSTPRAADGLRLAIALDDAWMFRGLQDQARRHYGALIEADGATDAERAKALSNYGFASTLVGDNDVAAGLLARARDLAESVGDRELVMRVQYHLGIASIEAGRPIDALPALRSGEKIARELGRQRSVSAFEDVIATANLYAGDAQAAAIQYHATNATDRETGHEHGLVRGLVNEASAWVSAGDFDAAVACAAEAEEHAARLGDLIASANASLITGRVAEQRVGAAAGLPYYRAALTRMGTEEIHTDAQLCRIDLANALVQTGELAEARALLDAVVLASSGHGVAWLVAQPTEAALALAGGDLPTAQQRLDDAEGEYEKRGFGWKLAVDRLARVRAALDAAGG